MQSSKLGDFKVLQSLKQLTIRHKESRHMMIVFMKIIWIAEIKY
jgi:hypothetical protein